MPGRSRAPTGGADQVRRDVPPTPDNSPWWYERLDGTFPIDAGSRASGLLALLQQLPAAEISDIMRQRGWSPRNQDRARCMAELAQLLQDSTEIARAATSLPQQLKTALQAALIAEDGSGVTPTGLANALTAIGATTKPVEAAGLLRDLAGYGLVIPWRDPPANGHHYLLPWDIQRSLPPLPGWCKAMLEPAGLEVKSAAGSRFLHVMHRVWQRILERPLRLRSHPEPVARPRGIGAPRAQRYGSRLDQCRRGIAAGSGAASLPTPGFLLDDSSVSALSPLADGDAEQIEFACRMLSELEMVTSDTDLLRAIPDVMERFLLGSSSKQQTILIQAYASMIDWNELDVLLRTDSRLVLKSDARPTPGQQELRSQLVRLHQMLLRFVATAADEGWCAFKDVGAALHPLWSDLAQSPQPDSQPRHAQVWHLAWRHDLRPLSPDRCEDWQAAQAALLRIMVEGPLHWLGTADLGYRDGGLELFHLHGLADRIWDRPMLCEPEESSGEAVFVDGGNLTLAVRPQGISAQGHALLGRMACLEKTAPSGFVYRLDLRVTYATFEHGESLSDLLSAWSQTMPAQMPQAIQEALVAWWAAYGQVRLYEGLALLEVGDDLTLRELEISTSLSKRILARLSPRQVLVSEKAVPVLVQEFAAKGLTPKEAR